MNARARLVLIAAALSLTALSASAAAPGGTGPREGLAAFRTLAPLGIGVDVEWMRRPVVFDDGARARLDADAVSAVFTADPARWLQLFASTGQHRGALAGARGRDRESRWSVGLSARAWHLDVNDPLFMAGRLSLGGTFEFSRTDFATRADEGHWDERFVSLVFAYEIFVEAPDALDRVPYSLRLYAGPVHSTIRGEVENGGVTRSFEEDRATGATWGVELFISHNLSVGFHGQHYDADTYRASLRYRF